MGLMAIGVAFASRSLLVLLFLPFSALDKVLNFDAAVGQAQRALRSTRVARGMIVAGLCTEIGMSTAILTGVADRMAALILACYCVVTALLWKQFWRTPDFKLQGVSRGRDIFWDFLKNLAVAGGFLLITFGTSARGVASFLQAPLSSTQPYAAVK